MIQKLLYIQNLNKFSILIYINIMSNNKPEIKIKGKIQDINKKEKNIKPKQSNFLLTINTN